MCGCRSTDRSVFRGEFCRCCGIKLLIDPTTRKSRKSCARETPCDHCHQKMCGIHSLKESSLGPERRFCEICSKPCENGSCPEHGLEQA